MLSFSSCIPRLWHFKYLNEIEYTLIVLYVEFCEKYSNDTFHFMVFTLQIQSVWFSSLLFVVNKLISFSNICLIRGASNICIKIQES